MSDKEESCGGMDNKTLILQALQEISPNWASNAQLKTRSGLTHQGIFSITRNLADAGLVTREQRGHEWFFRIPTDVGSVERAQPAPAVETPTSITSGYVFESVARHKLQVYFGCALAKGKVESVPKIFDFLSEDESIVGDAKFFDLVRGKANPPAKFSIIAEHVWLLEKTNAQCMFLVFGKNRDVPSLWLKRYRHLVEQVTFLFLDQNDSLEVLLDPRGVFSNLTIEQPDERTSADSDRPYRDELRTIGERRYSARCRRCGGCGYMYRMHTRNWNWKMIRILCTGCRGAVRRNEDDSAS